MAEKQKTLTSYLIGINVAQLVLALAVVLLKSLNAYSGYAVKGVVFVVMAIVWFAAALLASLGTNMLTVGRAFVYALLSVTPIIIVTAAAFLIGIFTPEGANGWAAFFFIGGAVNFFLRCGSILALFLKSAYVIYAVTIGVMFLASVFGCIVGIGANAKRIRSSRKRKPKENAQLNEEKSDDNNEFSKKSVKKKKKKKKTAVKKSKRDTDDEDF